MQGYQVQLAPSIQGGAVGWCVSLTRNGRVKDWSCDGVPSTNYAQVGYTPVSSIPSVIGVVTTSRAAAVSIDGGPRTPTSSAPSLPFGFRQAVFVASASGGAFPNLELFDAQGRALSLGPPPNYYVAARFWKPPNAEPQGVCQLMVKGLSSLTTQWGHVVTSTRSSAGVVGRAFESCVDTYYKFEGSSLDAAILLDASHPGALPAALPEMRPTPGVRGVFGAPGPPNVGGALTARRVGNAWLVVAGGSGAAQRLRVLDHLTATVR